MTLDSGPSVRRHLAAARPLRLLRGIIRCWAVAGGLLVCALAVMTALSATLNILIARPFPADYELVRHLTAIAIFAFLPYCQLSGANVTVDIFTQGAGGRAKAAMAALAAFLALAFSLLLLVQMTKGLQGYLRFPEVTPVLGLPLWTAFPPILVSLVLLAAASLVSLCESIARLRGEAAAAGRPIPME